MTAPAEPKFNLSSVRLKAAWARHRLDFRFTAITSRESLRHKDTYYIKVWCPDRPGVEGWGEAALFRGLSGDDTPGYEQMLTRVCARVGEYAAQPSLEALAAWPSIRFGLETALLDFAGGGRRVLHDTPWTRGCEAIAINGLVWMGDCDTMARRMAGKVGEGYECIKIKVGAQDFERELDLLRRLRSMAPGVEIRLDANGAFTPANAMGRLERLAPLGIHSIEQPLRQGQWEHTASLCRRSPIAIALDEELIGLNDTPSRTAMLEAVRPQYIILKPTLTGGTDACREWIDIASGVGAAWWATSALESDIGLNAIAQWVSTTGNLMPQGLGTGQLYSNNVASPLRLRGNALRLDPAAGWQMPQLQWK